MPNKPSPDTIAAVDLGSNSFHMIVARVQDGHLNIIDRLREPVRLAAGLDDRDRLRPEVQAAALACLDRFGQRVRGLAPDALRAVGTNTLRRAHNAEAFLADAQRALGQPIEIISGVEEARLIYLGVAHSLADDGGRRLVVDIGGGSTECIVGEGFRPLHLESLYMGCVSMSQRHFADGRLSEERFRNADLAARLELQPVEAHFRSLGWNAVTGASGTIRAVREVVVAEGWSDSGITLESLRRLRKAMVDAKTLDKLKLKGLSEDRRPVFAGGAAILLAAFESLGIERMLVAQGALREGLLYDQLGRIRQEDVRERSIEVQLNRYQVDAAHGARVEATALVLLRQAAPAWGLEGVEEADRLLAWAARLHELGLVVAHSQYHKHGGYLLANSDLPGFSRRDQALLAALVRGHRRKYPVAEFKVLPERLREATQRLCVLLRLAVLLHRSRSANPLPEIHLDVDGASLHLEFPPGWLEDHPLTQADLAQEAGYLKDARIKLRFD